METVTGTDEKIEKLDKKVGEGFARAEVECVRTDERFKRVDERFDEVDRHFDAVDRRFDRLEDKFDALNLTLLQIGGGLIGTLIAGIVALIVTQ
jgi:hypothetical protein